jgi:uncharacterized protein (DUF1684 family)
LAGIETVGQEDSAVADRYEKELSRWRARMEEGLRRRDGWLALHGLFWLVEGVQSAGSAPGLDIPLPASAPPRLGTFELREDEVYFTPSPDIDRPEGAPPSGTPLRPDTDRQPDFIRLADVTLVAIDRGSRRGLRVWDNAKPERTSFPGRLWFAPDPGARVRARFDPAPSGTTILIPDILGDSHSETLVGTATFVFQGVEGSLTALPHDHGSLWFVFGDATNGDTTYPGGRFLVAEAPVNGVALLDFNRAYNPPCAFTAFATCPLPPDGNRLAFAVKAGERHRTALEGRT